jgi:hypothetical protein
MSWYRKASTIAGLAVIAAILVAASWPVSGTSAGAGDVTPEVLPSTTAAAVVDVVAPSDQPELVDATPATAPAPAPIAPSWPAPNADTTRLVLVGDSLAQASSGLLAFLTAPKEFVPRFWGGTAPCDWVDDDLQADRSTIVVIQFTGNSLTPCMSDGAGGFLEHEAFADEYRGDLYVLITRARRAGARVLLVGQPERAPSFGHEDRVGAINGMLQEFAADWTFVSYVDAGAAVETPDGQFAERLPCTEFDTDCAADGQTVVRGDGVHFCPVVNVAPCPVYSSGALRFSLAIANAANDPATFD